jgi:sulfate/thiosulfate transport system substrate-binding protein
MDHCYGNLLFYAIYYALNIRSLGNTMAFMHLFTRSVILVIALCFPFASLPAYASEVKTLLNVSYDPTREFYDECNQLFIKHWKETKGEDVRIMQSHSGSGKQARSVIEGLQADVVTLALAYDIDMIAEHSKRIPDDWQDKFPHNSAPSTSTIVFLVRKGNPKQIKDWNDLIRDDVKVVTPNPKTSGGARWNYLAAWAYANHTFAGDETRIKDFMKKLFQNVPVLDAGARGATTTFIQRGIGDILITWENEAHLALAQAKNNDFMMIVPSISILAEPPVAMVEQNTQRKNTSDLAKAYLDFLYTPEAQALAAKYYFRPTDKKIAAEYAARFPSIKMVTIADFGGWKAAQKTHFSDEGTFDEIYVH